MIDNIFNPGLTTQLLQLLQNFHYCEILVELFFLFLNSSSPFNFLLLQVEAKKKKRSSEEKEKFTVRHFTSFPILRQSANKILWAEQQIFVHRPKDESVAKMQTFFSFFLFFPRINPRRRGKGSTKNMAEKRKRRRRLSRTRTSTENMSSIFLTAQKQSHLCL